MTDSGTQTPYS